MEIIHNITNVNSIRIFGSHARGDNTILSDYDVLVILKKSQTITSELEKKVECLFVNKISISWYCEKRIKKLFEMGHLFAWHLYKESLPVCKNDYIDQLGEPKEYLFAEQDVNSLIKILLPIKECANKYPRNLIYEAGLLFVCIRNIAISALPVLEKKYLFTTHSPYELNFPMTLENYNLLLHARYTSTRATEMPDLNLDTFNLLFNESILWARELQKKVKKLKYEN